MAANLRYISLITDSRNDQLVLSLREPLQYEAAVVSTYRSFGGAIEKYTDACQGFTVGGVLYDPRENIVLRPGNEARQTENQRYKDGQDLFHLTLTPGKGDPAKDNVMLLDHDLPHFAPVFYGADPQEINPLSKTSQV